jgi:hypothetical protein
MFHETATPERTLIDAFGVYSDPAISEFMTRVTTRHIDF